MDAVPAKLAQIAKRYADGKQHELTVCQSSILIGISTCGLEHRALLRLNSEATDAALMERNAMRSLR